MMKERNITLFRMNKTKNTNKFYEKIQTKISNFFILLNIKTLTLNGMLCYRNFFVKIYSIISFQ